MNPNNPIGPLDPVDNSKATAAAASNPVLVGDLYAGRSSVNPGQPRTYSDKTYVVQPGDSLFRVAERFYGDATQWKKIREANRARIDPDGRIRAGQIIVVP